MTKYIHNCTPQEEEEIKSLSCKQNMGLSPTCGMRLPLPEKVVLFQERGVLGARLKAFIGLIKTNKMGTDVSGDILQVYLLT